MDTLPKTKKKGLTSKQIFIISLVVVFVGSAVCSLLIWKYMVVERFEEGSVSESATPKRTTSESNPEDTNSTEPGGLKKEERDPEPGRTKRDTADQQPSSQREDTHTQSQDSQPTAGPAPKPAGRHAPRPQDKNGTTTPNETDLGGAKKPSGVANEQPPKKPEETAHKQSPQRGSEEPPRKSDPIVLKDAYQVENEQNMEKQKSVGQKQSFKRERKPAAKSPNELLQRTTKYVKREDDPDYIPDMEKVFKASKTNADYDKMPKNKMPYETIYDIDLDKFFFNRTYGNNYKADEDDISTTPITLNNWQIQDEKKRTFIKIAKLNNSAWYFEPMLRREAINRIIYDGTELVESTGNLRFVKLFAESIRGIRLMTVLGTDENDKRVGLHFKYTKTQKDTAQLANNYVHTLTDIWGVTFEGKFN